MLPEERRKERAELDVCGEEDEPVGAALYLVVHRALVGQIGFVSCQSDHDVGAGLPLQFLHPVLRTCECILEGRQSNSKRLNRIKSGRTKVSCSLIQGTSLCRGHVTHSVGDVVDHDGGLSSSVVHRRQAVVAFLSSSVPDLELHCCIVQTYRLCEEGSCKDSRKHTH